MPLTATQASLTIVTSYFSQFDITVKNQKEIYDKIVELKSAALPTYITKITALEAKINEQTRKITELSVIVSGISKLCKPNDDTYIRQAIDQVLQIVYATSQQTP